MGMMINRRRAYGGKKLPYDAEIEYIHILANQYINIPIRVASNLISDINCTIDNASDENVALLWNRYQTAAPQYAYSIILNPPYMNGNMRVDYGSSDGNYYQNYIDSINRFFGNAHIVFGKGKVIFNDIEFNLHYSSQTFTSPLNNYIIGHSVCSWKLNSWSISEDDTLIFDLIPVRVGNVGYLYDKVSGQLFGNEGPGAFILGPDV